MHANWIIKAIPDTKVAESDGKENQVNANIMHIIPAKIEINDKEINHLMIGLKIVLSCERTTANTIPAMPTKTEETVIKAEWYSTA